jgi:hypothetical protein
VLIPCIFLQIVQFLIAVSIGDVNPLDNIVASLYGALTDDSNTPIVKLVPTGNPRVWNLVTAAGLIDFESNNKRSIGVRVSRAYLCFVPCARMLNNRVTHRVCTNAGFLSGRG